MKQRHRTSDRLRVHIQDVGEKAFCGQRIHSWVKYLQDCTRLGVETECGQCRRILNRRTVATREGLICS